MGFQILNDFFFVAVFYNTTIFELEDIHVPAFMLFMHRYNITNKKIQEECKPPLAISDFLRGYRHAREGYFI